MGLDNFSTKLIKDAAPIIAKPIANIINSCLAKNDIPSEWKLARISPLFKEGDIRKTRLRH